MKNERLERVRNRLELYYEAEEKILSGAQSYAIGSRNLTRANLSEIQSKIKELEAEKRLLEKNASGKRKVARVVPVDR